MKKNQKKYGYSKTEWKNMSLIRKLERKLDRVNHIMELIRTVVPVMLLLLNTIIIFFSIFIGYFFLKETISLKKIISILLIVIGVIGIKLF